MADRIGAVPTQTDTIMTDRIGAVPTQTDNMMTDRIGHPIEPQKVRELTCGAGFLSVLLDAPSRLTESRDQSEKHLEFPMAPLGTWTCWYGTYRRCLSAAPACISQLGPIPTRPCIGHL